MTELNNNRTLGEITEEMLVCYREEGEKLAGKTGSSFNEAVLFLYWEAEFLGEIGWLDYPWDICDPTSDELQVMEVPDDAPIYDETELMDYINRMSGLDKDTITKLYEVAW